MSDHMDLPAVSSGSQHISIRSALYESLSIVEPLAGCMQPLEILRREKNALSQICRTAFNLQNKSNTIMFWGFDHKENLSVHLKNLKKLTSRMNNDTWLRSK